MIPHKQFKVASISSNPNSFGLYGHILVAEDGESWQVGRSRSGTSPKSWVQGEVIDAPLMNDPVRHINSPAWQELHCEIPQRLPDAPPNVIAEIWGKPQEPQAADPAPAREVAPSIVFTAEQFTATPWSTAREKADFANAFVRFVENNFQQAHFPKWFYRRLSQTFGHIAQFDETTFYRTFFGKAADKLRFLRQTVDHQPVGDPAFTYSDVERVLRDWVIQSGALERVTKTAAHAQNRAEREQLKRLLDKHGLPENSGDEKQ
jgi:hypothetical protein